MIDIRLIQPIQAREGSKAPCGVETRPIIPRRVFINYQAIAGFQRRSLRRSSRIPPWYWNRARRMQRYYYCRENQFKVRI